jgi:flagellar motor switch protein FliN/FliY
VAGTFRRQGIESQLFMNTLDQIEVEISVELGAAILPIHHLLRMGRGAVIELDSMHDDPLRIYANNTLIARGEVRVEDGRLSVEVTEKMFKRP